MKEFIIKDMPGFQLRIKKWECLKPEGLFAVNFTQATKDKEGNIDSESTYEFFMRQEEMNLVAKALAE
jgi:hypothetical protein